MAGACCSTTWSLKTTLKPKPEPGALGHGAGGTGTSGGAGGSAGAGGASCGLKASTQPSMHSVCTSPHEEQPSIW